MKNLYIIFFAMILFLISACLSERDKYKITKYMTNNESDTLLVDIVTYVGKKHKEAIYTSHFDPKFRQYYVQMSNQFKIVYFNRLPSGKSYYYMIRPAISARGNTRGVGGIFTTDANNKIIEFEELFNTPVLPEDTLSLIGWELFEEMIKAGNVDKYYGNIDFIEWPDERLKYDKLKNEWRYDLVDSIQ